MEKKMEENYDMRDVLLNDQTSKEQKNANLKRILTAIAILFVLLLIILIIMKSISSGNINDEKTIVMPSESEINKLTTQKSQEQNLTKPQVEPTKQLELIANVTSNLDATPKETNKQNASQQTTSAQTPSNEPLNQAQSAPVYKETIILKANDDVPKDETHKADAPEPKKEQNETQKVVTDLTKQSAKSTVVVTADKKQSEEVKQHSSQKQKKADEKITKESKKTTNLDKTDKKVAQKDVKAKNNPKEKEQKTSKNESVKQDKKTQISKNEVEEKSSKNAKKQKQTAHKQENVEKVSGWLHIRSMSGHNANIKDDPIYGKISSMKYKLENVEVKGEKRTRVLVPYSNADERAELKAQFPGAW